MRRYATTAVAALLGMVLIGAGGGWPDAGINTGPPAAGATLDSGSGPTLISISTVTCPSGWFVDTSDNGAREATEPCVNPQRTHATDCTGLTVGALGEYCWEQDSNRIFVCEPTAGGCDTAAEWIIATNDSVKIASNYAGADLGAQINAAIDASPAGGTILVTESGTLSTMIEIDQSNTTLRCNHGVTITGDGTDEYVVRILTPPDTVTTNVAIEGCIFDGANDAQLLPVKAQLVTNLAYRNNTINNFDGGVAYFYGIVGAEISGNVFTDSGCSSLLVLDAVQRDASEIRIHDNTFFVTNAAGTDCQAIGVAGGASNDIRAVAISNNTVNYDEATGWCIEIYSAVADPGVLSGYEVHGNHCYRTNAGSGCFSVVQTNNVNMTGNVCDSDGTADGNGATEFGPTVNGVFSNNVLVGDDPTITMLQLDRCESCVVSGNVLVGPVPNGILVGATRVAPDQGEINDVVVSDNVIIAPAAGGTRGIYVQSNVAGNEVHNVVVRNNIINGSGDAAWVGIRIAEDAGSTLDTVDVAENVFSNMGTGVQVASGADIVSVVSNRFNSVTTEIATGVITEFLVNHYGADPPNGGATCRNGSMWLDTDTASDTNCTTAANGAICRCVGGAWLAVGE